MPAKRPRERVSIENLFVPDVGLTDAGSVRLQLRPAPPLRSFYGHERQIAAFVHDLAAELERRCDRLGVGWVVSAEPFNGRIILEIGEGEDPEAAAQLVADLLTGLGLV